MKKIALILIMVWSPLTFSDQISEQLQIKLNKIRTMSASFVQVVRAKKRQVSHSTGTMALSRPGRFRWQTKTPMAQLVVADGQRLWVYDEDLDQVTVKKQDKGLGGTAALFLSGYGDTVTRDFKVTERAYGNTAFYDLRSKSTKAHFLRLKLTFVGGELRAMVFFDQLGQQTDVTLNHVKTNLSLAGALFRFKAPKGVDVVEQ